MRDLYFFGGAVVLSVALVGGAMAFDPRTEASAPLSVGTGPRDYVAVTGKDLNRFRQTRRDTVTLIRPENQPYYLKLTSRRNSDLPTNAQDVAYLPLSTDLEIAFAQRKLKITMTARSAPQNGSPAMRAEYWASGDGNSDWQSFLLTPEWQDYTFTFTPPASENARSLDFLAIWADPDGLGRGVEVQKVVFDSRS